MLNLLKKELTLYLRNRYELIVIIAFFITTITLFHLGLGSDFSRLNFITPTIIWIAALLAIILSLPNLFENDYIDGTLELTLTTTPPIHYVAAKLLTHIIIIGGFLVILTPIISYMLGTENNHTLTLMLGMPSLIIIGAFGSAITIGARKSNMIIPLLVMPLYVPILIFGVNGHILALISILLITIPIFILSICLSLKIAVSDS